MLQKALTDKFTELLKIHREASGLSQTDISEMPELAYVPTNVMSLVNRLLP